MLSISDGVGIGVAVGTVVKDVVFPFTSAFVALEAAAISTEGLAVGDGVDVGDGLWVGVGDELWVGDGDGKLAASKNVDTSASIAPTAAVVTLPLYWVSQSPALSSAIYRV